MSIPLRNSEKQYILPDAIWKHVTTIGPMAFSTYSLLCRLSDGGVCEASMSEIANALGVTRNTIVRAIQALEQVGLIEVVNQYGESGGRLSNKYIIVDWPMGSDES